MDADRERRPHRRRCPLASSPLLVVGIAATLGTSACSAGGATRGTLAVVGAVVGAVVLAILVATVLAVAIVPVSWAVSRVRWALRTRSGASSGTAGIAEAGQGEEG